MENERTRRDQSLKSMLWRILTVRVLILDDIQQRHDQADAAFIGCERVHAWTAGQAIEALRGPRFDVATLDHDLGLNGDDPGTGYDVARFIVEEMPSKRRPKRVLIHSFNPVGSKRMFDVMHEAGVRVTMCKLVG